MPQEPWYPGKGTKSDHIIQLNCREVCSHASYKTTRTWESFNNQWTKMILLSDELWLIANNSKNWARKHISNKLIIFFSIRVFFHGHWQLTAQQGNQGSHLFIPLYHFHLVTNIQTFIYNFACEMTATYF